MEKIDFLIWNLDDSIFYYTEVEIHIENSVIDEIENYAIEFDCDSAEYEISYGRRNLLLGACKAEEYDKYIEEFKSTNGKPPYPKEFKYNVYEITGEIIPCYYINEVEDWKK